MAAHVRSIGHYVVAVDSPKQKMAAGAALVAGRGGKVVGGLDGLGVGDEVFYRALVARDPRFDGVFFVGVRTTGIYCRPVCTAKTPGRRSCRFFASAALAEQAGFRPCLRCRPELAPGQALIDNMRTTARAAAARIEAGALSGGRRLEELAASLGVSTRQLRRSMRQELGVSPVQLAQTSRLLLAKRLIAETNLPMVQVALAAGFDSLRRFNATFREHYRLTPSRLRRATAVATPASDATAGEMPADALRAEHSSSGEADDSLRLTLAYRPPLAWETLLRFLAARAIPGVECVTDATYARTVCIGEERGWVRVSPIEGRHLLAVELATSLVPVLPAVLVRLRNLFDLDARPDVIAGHLADSPLLSPLVRARPGLRVPGAFGSFELLVRAFVGQQVSVRGATTLAGWIARRFGEPIETPVDGLTHLAPSPESIAAADAAELTALGVTSARAKAIVGVARAVAAGEVDLEASADPSGTIGRLVELPGIGPWTANYFAMRALRWPDAFPAGDLGLLKAAGTRSERALAQLAEAWRPWRAYAAMHLWESLTS